ncbi:hypothetical protein D3C75_731230 [compost metagenome]
MFIWYSSGISADALPLLAVLFPVVPPSAVASGVGLAVASGAGAVVSALCVAAAVGGLFVVFVSLAVFPFAPLLPQAVSSKVANRSTDVILPTFFNSLSCY